VSTGRLDWPAIRTGALVSIAICLPLALLSQAIVDEDADTQPPVVYLLYLGILAGFVVGGALAAKRTTESPYTSGAVAALGAFLLIQLAGVVARLVDGDDIRVTLIVTNALLAYGAGLLGAGFVARRQRTT
jgi:putative membrane protein (TIGR04086 family)